MQMKLKRKDSIQLIERLSMYISAGLALDKVLEMLFEGFSLRQKRQRAAVAGMRAVIESGGSLSAALERYANIPPAAIGLIAHGESSEGLARALRSVHALMEREDELKKKVFSAMTYPLVIGLFAGGLTIGLVRGVMPQIIPMLKGLHAQLPLLTRVVMKLSDGLMSYGLSILAGFIPGAIAGRFAYRRWRAIRRLCQSLWLRIPIIGGLINECSLAVFLRSFGSLVESGVAVPRAYENTARSVSLEPLKGLLRSKISAITHGVPVGAVLKGKGIPTYIPGLLSAGEASGTLGASILRAAEILDRDIEHSLKRLTAMVEPVMMAGMGCVVGAIALSIMMPIYDISKVLQK